jgi:predicted HTH transcriptional regulator
LISDSIRPQLLPTIELVPLAGKTVLVAEVWLGQQRPYYIKRLGPHQGAYIRIGSTDRQASAGMVAELRRHAQGESYDESPARRAKLSDLDTDHLSRLLKRDVDEQALRTLNLVVEEQGQLVPTNGGVLVGSAHPETFLPHAWVQCARFRGDSRRVITDQARVLGPLPDAVDKTMDFLKRNAFLRAEFGEIYRQDVYSIPLAPLRELVINALVHSSYADHGTPIKIAFYDTSIVIESPGGLLPGLTVERVLEGVSVIRNPVLARVFSELGLIEQWGTGLPNAMEAIIAAGLPPIDIEEGHERLKITVHIENHDPAQHQVESEKHQVEHQVEQDVDPTEQEVKQDRWQRELGQRGDDIIRLVAQGPQTRAAILTALGLTNNHRAYTRHIVPLVDAGLLVRTAPDSPRAPTQRYALTEAGRALLADL